MPEISRFHGIVIEMWRNENHRRPHFHAKYGRYAISMMIDDGSILGEFPPQAQAAKEMVESPSSRAARQLASRANATATEVY